MFYQTKVLEDKPIAYFDTLPYGYSSLLTESQRSIVTGKGWALAGATTTTSFSLSEEAPTSATTTKVTSSSTSGSTLTLTSPALGKMKDLRAGMGITASFYLRVPSNNTNTVRIKFQYNNGSWTDIGYSDIPVPDVVQPTWLFFTHTVQMSQFASALKNEDVRIVISITDQAGGDPALDYVYYINGIACGQGAENRSSFDFGSQGAYIQHSLCGGAGELSVSEYNGLLTAVPSGVPLHHSVSNSIMLQPNVPETPSLEVSGSGFMDEATRNDIVTLEFWMKTGGSSNSVVRIVGPTASTDGLYLSGTTITLSISGREYGYDIGTIDYPMLIHWIVSPSHSTVLLNGDAVINAMFEVDTSGFATDCVIGFYTDRSIHPIYVSSIATYQYAVPSAMAKVRFVQGQGTNPYGIIADRYDGASHSADFSTAQFASNLSYPDNVLWRNGIYSNLAVSDTISALSYNLPELVRAEGQDWAALNKSVYEKPSPSYTNVFPLDISRDNTSGTAFTNAASKGEVFTTQTLASSSTNSITLPSSWQPGMSIEIYGEAKFAGTVPSLKVTFVGPNTTYTQSFTNTVPKATASMTHEVPEGTTSITWGVSVGAGMTSGQFNNVYARLVYPQSMFFVKPSGMTTEPYMYWDSLNVLGGAPVESLFSTFYFDESLDMLDKMSILTLSKKNTSTKISVTLEGGVVKYIYSDISTTEELFTDSVTLGKNITIGIHIADLSNANEKCRYMLGSPDSIEVSFGGGDHKTMPFGVWQVAFCDALTSNLSNVSYVDGIAEINETDGIPTLHQAAYSLQAVTAYSNFSLDVASVGVWQETVPLSVLTKFVKAITGEEKEQFDFIQATIGRTRANLSVSSYEPITYFQLQSQYWGKMYSDLASDFSTYSSLAALTLPVYNVEEADVETWVALDKITATPVPYYLKEEHPHDGSTTAFIDDNGKRYFVQDGFSIVVPYTLDYSQYVMTVYHIVKTRGQRSCPAKLKSFELASWATGADEWAALGTQEGQNCYPYTHNGAYYVTDFPNIFETTKRGFNYLYKSNRSGFKPKTLPMPGYDSGVAVQWNRPSTRSEERQLAAISTWMMLESDSLGEEMKVLSLSVGATDIMYVNAVPLDGGSKFGLQAMSSPTVPFTDVQWFVNGNIVGTPVINVKEWNSVQMAFSSPIDTANEQVFLRASGDSNMSFDHITLHGRLKSKVSGASLVRKWSDIALDTWNGWVYDEGSSQDFTWYSLFDVGSVQFSDMLFDEMYAELTGTGALGDFSADAGLEFGEVYVLRDIEWVSLPVIAK